MTPETIHLHFDPLDDFPDVIPTIFSYAVTAPFSKKANWDIPSVISLTQNGFPDGQLDEFIPTLETVHRFCLQNRAAASVSPDRRITFEVPSLGGILAKIQFSIAICGIMDRSQLLDIIGMIEYEDPASVIPQTCDTIEDIRSTTGIHGPCKIGQMDSSIGHVTVESSPGAYHRPNSSNSPSETDSSDGGVDLSEYDEFKDLKHIKEELNGYATGNSGAGNQGEVINKKGNDEDDDGYAVGNSGECEVQKESQKGWTERARSIADKVWPRP
ncbi:hypothetical protein B0T14DRAFT_563788 [Immersiella caudata]|uniref:Uncharacterized protein n=1 Tax=Immersiella caudata TaxID=314043 RepID=A0AA40C2W0_9PEZI|nr:hypothetical protein B0T14DRAFT_563788 [Immersiella caudata]